ncbi:MAG: PspA/IM30 family protein [Acidimicrobiia bacterium]
MWKLIKRWWKYLVMREHLRHEQITDPKVQLEQSMQEAHERDRVLREQAAIVLANQKQAQARLDRAVANYEKAQTSAGQALLLADQETRLGHSDKAASLTATAEGFAERMLALHAEIADLERALLTATSAAAKAKANVQENAERLIGQMRDKQRLLDELDRTKVQEALNQATAAMSATIGSDVPTYDEVSKKIHQRTFVAESQGELLAMLAESSLDTQMLEIEKAQRHVEAQAQLADLRSRLGLPPATPDRPFLLRPAELAAADELADEPQTREVN